MAGAPAHYLVQDGYFPTGSADADALAARIESVTVYQLRPKRGDPDAPLASGTLTLRDPDAGTGK